MKSIRTSLIVSTLALAACANQDGVYEPSCMAYEGNRIELRAGRFEWQRFTDQRTVDTEGNVIDPFPQYPKTGTYNVQGGRVEMTTDDEERLEDWFIVKHDGRRYLLNKKEHNVFQEAENLSDCALALDASK